jgi:hypothetical protein
MLSSAKLAAFLLWIAIMLLVLQPMTSVIVTQVGQSTLDCCPGCEDDGDRETDQTSDLTCSCIACSTFDMVLEGSSSTHDVHTSPASLFEMTLPLQSLGCSVFHPPIAS